MPDYTVFWRVVGDRLRAAFGGSHASAKQALDKYLERNDLPEDAFVWAESMHTGEIANKDGSAVRPRCFWARKRRRKEISP